MAVDDPQRRIVSRAETGGRECRHDVAHAMTIDRDEHVFPLGGLTARCIGAQGCKPGCIHRTNREKLPAWVDTCRSSGVLVGPCAGAACDERVGDDILAALRYAPEAAIGVVRQFAAHVVRALGGVHELDVAVVSTVNDVAPPGGHDGDPVDRHVRNHSGIAETGLEADGVELRRRQPCRERSVKLN